MARAAARMSIRIDRKVKAHSQQRFKSLGLDMTTAINIFLRQSLLHKGLPFEVTAGSADSAFMKKLAEADSDTDIREPFQTVEALMDDLNSERR